MMPGLDPVTAACDAYDCSARVRRDTHTPKAVSVRLLQRFQANGRGWGRLRAEGKPCDLIVKEPAYYPLEFLD